MSRLIKSTRLHSINHAEEYFIDPARVGAASHRVKSESPEDIARSIVAQAEAEAESLIAEARMEAEMIRSSAYQEGCESAAGQLEEERAALAERASQIEADAQRQIDQFWVGIEPEILKLAVSIARKIVRHEVDENQQLALDTVSAGLIQLRDKRDLKIRVNPADYELVREQKERILSSCDGINSIEVVNDRRVDRGGCMIESGNGHLDARMETQLKEAERALMEASRDGK